MTDETKKEPTMAEALATVREGLHELEACATSIASHAVRLKGAEAEEHLALLERRMGAMERALRGCRAHLKCTEGCACDVCTALTDAPKTHAWAQETWAAFARSHGLTDAPPVFTLEEVVAAVNATLDAADATTDFKSALRERLAALRR